MQSDGKKQQSTMIDPGYWCRFKIFHRIVSTLLNKKNVIQSHLDLVVILFPFQYGKFIQTMLCSSRYTFVVDGKIKKLKELNKLKILLGEIIISENNFQAKSQNQTYIFGEDICNTERLHQYLKSIDYTIPTQYSKFKYSKEKVLKLIMI
ncbi:unnamed protein product [Paramecium octaurelia]|uniref:Uncharacterized protein n=1 Tax=Paramecium octaurelia TaxID=43137 RepID=A0A8S1W5T4_PAROT|nr:unnamed protein product [Paramecium octaurelia]CAD8183321.1 unnamed protein product [Paramecium octaurelia]